MQQWIGDLNTLRFSKFEFAWLYCFMAKLLLLTDASISQKKHLQLTGQQYQGRNFTNRFVKKVVAYENLMNSLGHYILLTVFVLANCLS